MMSFTLALVRATPSTTAVRASSAAVLRSTMALSATVDTRGGKRGRLRVALRAVSPRTGPRDGSDPDSDPHGRRWCGHPTLTNHKIPPTSPRTRPPPFHSSGTRFLRTRRALSTDPSRGGPGFNGDGGFEDARVDAVAPASDNAPTAPTSNLDGSKGGVESSWRSMLASLVEYKARHGHSIVPTEYASNPPLGNWVDNQRQLFRIRMEAEDRDKQERDVHEDGCSSSSSSVAAAIGARMTDEKIAALNSIGFVWNLNDHMWNVRYEELNVYVVENGNTLVPNHWPANEALGVWVMVQRSNYQSRRKKEKEMQTKGRNHVLDEDDNDDDEKKCDDDRPFRMIDERIQKLNDCGFIWDVNEAQWLERVEQLQRYHDSHGDTNVPKVFLPNPQLGRWVEYQRADYKKFLKNKKAREEMKNTNGVRDEYSADRSFASAALGLLTGMTEKRVRILDEKGFIWDPLEYAWECKYGDLCHFVAENGHAHVQMRGGGNSYKPLGRWAQYQRVLYNKFRDGARSTMTKERIEKLEGIGFVWDLTDAKAELERLGILGKGHRGRRLASAKKVSEN